MHKLLLPIILIAIFIAGFFFSRDALKKINIPTQIREIITNTKETCGEECKKIIKEEVEKAIVKIPAPTSKSTVAISTPQSRTEIISFDGSYTTTSTTWVDVPGTEVTFDIGTYGASPTATWQASLKVAHGNGQAFARIYDSTHGIAVNGSEISTTNNADYKNVSSGNLGFWSGNNTYKVQVKSLNSFEISYTGGKIKIVVR